MTPSNKAAPAGAGELLPCPFCGGVPVMGIIGDDDGGYYYVECRTCNGGRGNPFLGVHADEPEEAHAIWNRRANLRSATPHGFARAVFEANAPAALSNAA